MILVEECRLRLDSNAKDRKPWMTCNQKAGSMAAAAGLSATGLSTPS